jgi:cytoskeletal protein RodZ
MFGGLGGIVSSALSAVKPFAGLLGDAGTAYSSYRNAAMNRDFQEEMSGTSYQRAVADLNAAGLSPMLAYSKGGASTPSGSVADPVKLGETGQRTSSADLQRAQVDVAKSQEQVNIQTAKQVAAQAAKTAIEVEQMPTRFYYDLANLGSQINQSTAQAGQTSALESLTRQGKAPAPDTNIVRNIKDAVNYGGGAVSNAKSALDNIISRTYKSLRGIK